MHNLVVKRQFLTQSRGHKGKTTEKQEHGYV